MVVVCAFALGVVFTTYLVVGAVLDLYRWRTRKLTDRATSLFGIALYEPYSEIGHAVDSLQMLPKRVVLAVALRLSLDLDAEIQRRLVDVVATTGLTRRIRRLSRSGRWRRRQRAGRLAHLLEHDSPVRSRLLADPNAQVRAAVIESLSAEHAAAHVESLLAMLDAPEFAVEYVAEEALLRSDGRIIPDPF